MPERGSLDGVGRVQRMRLTSRSAQLAAASLALIAACADPTGSTGAIELTVLTDHPAYSLATDQAAEPILINRGSVRVYLPMNEYVAVQRFEAGAWSEPRPWFAVDGVEDSFTLEPGATLRSLPMNFGYVASTPGVYRFIFEIAKDPKGRELLSESQRMSPPFELTQ
jgi:hypothetical protein